MNIDIPVQAKVSDILKTVQTAEEGSHIYCCSDRHFSLLKICLIKLQKTDLNIYQLDDHGFTLKQVSAKRKELCSDQDVVAVEVAPLADDFPEIDDEGGQVASAVLEPVMTEQALSSMQESSVAPKEQRMSSKQISAVRDLEQALRRCKELELLVVGFSDGLVAVPETLGYGTDAISSAEALEVESFDVYRGYEADDY